MPLNDTGQMTKDDSMDLHYLIMSLNSEKYEMYKGKRISKCCDKKDYPY